MSGQGHNALDVLREKLARGTIDLDTGAPVVVDSRSENALARVEAVIEAAQAVAGSDGVAWIRWSDFTALRAALADLDARTGGET